MTEQPIKLRQPSVFYLSLFSGMFERFGFYVLSYLLVLYIKSIYGLTDIAAFTLFGVFNGLVFLTPAIGGYLADNIIGIRRCVVIGLILEGSGLIMLSLGTGFSFWVGLALIVIGEGLFKTAPTNLMARAYKENDPRIDSGFTLYYMSINIGSLCSSISAGVIQQYYGWSTAFLVAGIALFVGLLCYFVLKHTARDVDAKPGYKKLSPKTWLFIFLGLILGIAFAVVLVTHALFADIFFGIATTLLFIYFLYEIIKSKQEEKLRIIACVLLIIMGFVFFVLYFQLYTSMTLFIKRNVIHQLLWFKIPTVVFLGLNGFWIIVLGPILVFAYNYLSKRGKDLSVTTKFPLGLLLVSLGFFVLQFSTYFANADAKVSSYWIVFSLFLYSFGELLISALGVAMVTHIAPKRMYGVMMGAWFLIAAALGAYVSGLFAGLSSVPATITDPFAVLHIYSRAFFEIGLAGLVITVLAFIASPYIKRMANLNDQ